MNRILRFFKRIPCLFGHHKWGIGFGWAKNKRYDFCLNCKTCRWVSDPIGYNKITNP